ncbi:AraC-like DNA-binding protein [Mucilaginibacter sp. UYNi724]
MPTKQEHTERPKIAYSCYVTRSREGEQFVPEHVFSYHIAGTMTINDGQKESVFKPGDFRFIMRNNLVKFLKVPPPNSDFKSVSVYLDQQTLRNFSIEYGFKCTGHYTGNAVMVLPPQPLYKSFMESIIPYQSNDITIDDKLQELKLREAILILLQSKPEMKDVLFDFSEPGKIDLEGFMEKNFHFNVQLKRFAYLTGRSLATFKRDFEKIYHITPSRWLQQRRLQEAHYLIKEKGKSASDVYLELGFEDLSHFSFAFKNKYGVAPSRIKN